MAVVAAQFVRHQVGGRDAGRDTVKVAQRRAERQVGLFRADARACIEPFRRIVEFGEVVVAAVDEVADFLQRQARRLRPVQHVAVGEALGQHRAVGDALLIGTVEVRDRVRRGGARRRDFAEVLNGEAGIAEQRVREDFPEHRQRLRLIVAPECPELDVIGFGELQQHLNGDRTLVPLDQIEVTCRDAEIGGHARLGQAALAAKPPNARTGKDFFLRGHAALPANLP